MSLSETDIANLALTHCGVSKAITSLDERSDEARLCLRWYALTRDELLASFPWSFATVEADLTQTAVNPTSEWGYAYAYPSDALRLLRTPSGVVRNESAETRRQFRVVGSAIYSDWPSGTLEYVQRVTDPGLFPVDFAIALSWQLAARIAPALISENGMQRTELLEEQAERYANKAKARAANEEGPDQAPPSGFEVARGSAYADYGRWGWPL